MSFARKPHEAASYPDRTSATGVGGCGSSLWVLSSDELLTGIPLSTEHIVPVATGGQTVRDNLWRSCRPCNESKGARTHVDDPETGESVLLYNPRTQPWNNHFRWELDGVLMIGLTATGRATIQALQLNRSMLVSARRRWVSAGWHPPSTAGDI